MAVTASAIRQIHFKAAGCFYPPKPANAPAKCILKKRTVVNNSNQILYNGIGGLWPNNNRSDCNGVGSSSVLSLVLKLSLLSCNKQVLLQYKTQVLCIAVCVCLIPLQGNERTAELPWATLTILFTLRNPGNQPR